MEETTNEVLKDEWRLATWQKEGREFQEEEI